LKVLEEAKNKGMPTYAFVGPLLPFLSDSDANITSILKAIQDIGVDYFYLDKLNLRYGVWPALLKLLHAHHPELIDEYRKIFFQAGARMAYADELASRARGVARRLGMADKMTLCI
jgi:DNA repair photolyase